MKTGRAAENRHFSVNGITEFNRHIAVNGDLSRPRDAQLPGCPSFGSDSANHKREMPTTAE